MEADRLVPERLGDNTLSLCHRAVPNNSENATTQEIHNGWISTAVIARLPAQV
jgi:hypothetical protein